MRKAFTLLELLVVVGIMGMLGAAASGGYAALQRGMAERSAVAVASAVLRSAQERAHVDRMPTVVYCYNRLLKAPTGTEDNGVAVGVMVAVRRYGRISYVQGNLLFDEFADLDTTYDCVEDEASAKKSGGFRLFKFGGNTPSKMEYAIVSDQVVCNDNLDLHLFDGGKTNFLSSAFVDVGGGTVNASSWRVGDGYGLVFAEVQLPQGFVFGQTVPMDPKQIKESPPLYFDPDDVESTKTIEIWSTKPNASGYPQPARKAGVASADSKKAV